MTSLEDDAESASQLTQEQEHKLQIHPPPLNNSHGEFLEYLVYSKVPELKDDIDSLALAERSIVLKEELKVLENETVNTAKNQKQGLNSWSIQGRSEILMNSVASSSDYQKRVTYIQHLLGFGKDHVVSPLFVPQEMNGVYLCQFQYVDNDKKTRDTSKQKLMYVKKIIPIL